MLAFMLVIPLAAPVHAGENLYADALDMLSRREKARTQAWLNRAGRYIPTVRELIAAHGLPEELVFLPLIESGYNPQAVSPVGALGMWQFMEHTARRYGLRVDARVDERLDPERATNAAIAYLKDLHGMFGDWNLALMAYNAGENRIVRILSREEDPLVSLKAPEETRRYVPLFWAAVEIAMDPGHYGFSLPERNTAQEATVSVIMRDTTLQAKAKEYKTTAKTLKALNPALLGDVIPRSYMLRRPKT
jgi:membrane-bound lytic murein transglycosylase D